MKSKRSTSEKPRILVDTTFLLPAMGVEVEEEAMKVIPLFRRLEVHYLEVALLEALWKVLRVVPRRELNRVRLGIEAIRATYKVLTPPPEAYVNAIKIYDEDHRDYIDALHYETARATGTPWLTIDYEFKEFLEKKGYPVEGITLTPDNLWKVLGKNSGEQV
ncbi:PIN domain-containing protein [Desulfurococcus amylolyticus]|uniref:PIN domain-containing protein n=1 Tax=Desulfurococcus amylolyticus TaxID=94694 RepID=UPI0023F3FE65|nr:PIN domain-containing protein [Desulfurococcus amylolyticus]